MPAFFPAQEPGSPEACASVTVSVILRQPASEMNGNLPGRLRLEIAILENGHANDQKCAIEAERIGVVQCLKGSAMDLYAGPLTRKSSIL